MVTVKWINGVQYVRVMEDMRDGSKDYWLPEVLAKKLLEENKLCFELTNHCYCEEGKYHIDWSLKR